VATKKKTKKEYKKIFVTKQNIISQLFLLFITVRINDQNVKELVKNGTAVPARRKRI
jgi:hypothetical protein